MGGSQIIGADAVIVVMVKLDRGEFWIEDESIASGYILLAAEQYDVGACWVHIRNRRGRKGSSDEEIRELLDVPDGYAVLNLIALGGKGEIKRGYTESDFDFSKVHQELF
jgi:nitroreductase